MFEHGALHPDNPGGKSIVHAHLHIFPNETSLIEEIKKYDFEIMKIDNIVELREICHQYESYLYYQDIDGQDYVITHQGVPSQFLRKVLADVAGIENWNWREEPYIDKLVENLKFYMENDLVIDDEKDL